MATENKCPHCGKPVPTTALPGLCPECMLKAGLAETGEVGPDGTAVKKSSAPPVPSIEDIAPHFPQLEILECLGRGGMGTVYQARQPRLDRFVALKILTRHRNSGITDTEFAARFQQEARALARLSHPDIVAVYDFGEAGGFPYLLMEYVDGLTLRQLLQTRKISPEEALAIVPKICEALQFAHERGIVHRDIKPENILLDKQGRVKIADFGIAKILGPEAAGGNLTGAKDRLGTPHYMAPEQVETPQKVDHRADIYSLGVVFYEMLTGELPLGKFQPPSKKVHVDVRLDEVVLHALEKEPARRYQHASEVKTDVETIAASSEGMTSSPRVRGRFPGTTRHWFAPLVVVQDGERVVHWPGVLQDSFMLAGIYCVAWLAVVTVLSPVIGTVHFGFLVGGLLGFLPGMLAFGFYRSFKTPRDRLTHSEHRTQKPADMKNCSAESRNLKTEPDQPQLTSGAMKRWVTVARWTARVFGTLLLVFYGVFILAEGLPPIGWQPEGVQFNFVALGLMLVGFAGGWKSEGPAALLIASGWTLWQVSEASIKWNFFQTPLPVAALYGFCWWATRGRRTGVVLSALFALGILLGLGRLFVPTSVFVHGQVMDALTGQPVPDVELRLLPRPARADKGDYPNARSDQDGHYRLYVGWYAAGKQVAVSSARYATLTTNLGPRALGQRNLSRDFALQPLAESAGSASALRPSVPPVVVETFPVSGTAGVDPGLTQIRATFSKPMQDGDWAWCKYGEDNYPETTGTARFLNERTCMLPVRLQPGKVYALWLNSESHPTFKDRDGHAAVPYLLIFQTKP